MQSAIPPVPRAASGQRLSRYPGLTLTWPTLLLHSGSKVDPNETLGEPVDESEWVDLAAEALHSLVDTEGALVWTEVEAKLSESADPLSGRYINPHILSQARTRLLKDGRLVEETRTSRTTRPVNVFRPGDLRRRATRVERASRRKALLYGRYLSWAMGTSTQPAIVGNAAERVVHASLCQAAPEMGFRLPNPETGQVAHLFGEQINDGPLDNAAHVQLYDETDTPSLHITLLVEVKNVRECLYPSSDSTHQLLTKAARLQASHPGRRLLPVLVCRKNHYTLFNMAKDLGFLVFPLDRQWVVPHPRLDRHPGDRAYLQEVRHELSFVDLQTEQGPHEPITRRFIRVIRKYGAAYSSRWAHYSPLVADQFAALRRHGADPAFPDERSNRLRQHARNAGATVNW